MKDRLSMVKKTPAQIWEQLDDLYGDPKVQLREAMEELHGLDHKKLGENFVTKFTNTLLDTEALLETNHQADYLRHPREVDDLLSMLPVKEQKEFVKRRRTYIGGDYARLKAFLVERKTEEDDMMKMGWNSKKLNGKESKKCSYCQGEGHEESTCSKKKFKEKSDTGRGFNRTAGKTCWSCGEEGHVQAKCPKENPDEAAGLPKFGVSSNHMRPADCGRCRNAGNLPGSISYKLSFILFYFCNT